ncbi:MAG: hypothetical protein KME08_14720 [Aphanothece sp. CMT-3BRIN-NPC111]|jgi:hypothetical protein|nr:hypothetical protein [Aphanothece sp. CMT-3BRIN-NPC111]
MPRLKGKQSNNGLAATLLLAIIVIGIAVPIGYSNVINLTDIGKKQELEESASSDNKKQPALANDTIDKVEKIDK